MGLRRILILNSLRYWRNGEAGARVKCELDAERSTLTTVPAEGEKAQTLTVAEYLAMDEAARAAITIKYIKMVAKVVELYSIG